MPGRKGLDPATKAERRQETLRRYAEKNKEKLREAARLRMQRLRAAPAASSSTQAAVHQKAPKSAARDLEPRDVIREGDTDDHTVRRARKYRETGEAEAFDANNNREFLVRTQHEEHSPPPRPRPSQSNARHSARSEISSSPEREGEEISSREITSRPRKRPRRAISPEREGVAHPLTRLQTPLSPSPRRPHSQSPRPRPRRDTPSESSDSNSQPDSEAERPSKKPLLAWACCEPKCACVCHGLRLGVAPWLPVDS